jgi:hypothetical protein
VTLTIRKEDSVPAQPVQGRGRPMSPEVRAYVERFKHFRAGKDSFFVEGATAKDLEFLRRPVTRAGMGILIRYVQCDEIHGVAGVRVWRLAGSYDEI